jgi:hypothetical protein
MASAPHRYSRVDNADYLLNAWAVSWVAHQSVTDPIHLFDANIFWPGKRTLGYSEALLVQGVIAAPVRWLGGSPVLTYNVALLLGFFLTAFAFGWLVHRWTGSLAAALVAASAAAFNAHVITRIAHLQTMHVEFLAVALYALDRVMTRERTRDAVALAFAFVLQGLTSIYLLTFTTWAMVFAGAARLPGVPRDRRVHVLRRLVLASVIAIALLAPYLYTYYRIYVSEGFSRGLAENRMWAGSASDYLSTVSWLHFPWSRPFYESSRSTNFPGVTVLALAIAALAVPAARRDPRVRMCAAVAAGCVLVSLAPRLPGYGVLHGVVPLFWAVRVQAHIGQIVLLSLAILAGFGTAWLASARRWSRASWHIAAGVLVVAVNAEVFRAPMPLREFTGIPAVYSVLRGEERAVALEFPVYAGGAVVRNAWYEFYSTAHWKPIGNGYSGFLPRHYERLVSDVREFPAEHVLQALHRRGFTHAVVHQREFIEQHGQPAFDAVVNAASMREIASDGNIHIYKLR